MKATQFIKNIESLSALKREEAIKEALEKNHVPSFMASNMKEITVHSKGNSPNTLVYKVYPDYLAIGEDDDYVLMPMCPQTARAFLEKNNLMLPTPRMVDQIYAQSTVKLLGRAYAPKSGQPNRDSAFWYAESDSVIKSQRGGNPKETFFAGHKKDVVLVNALTVYGSRDKVCIYGWMDKYGNAIQPVSTVHAKTYVDYSHGLRPVSTECLLNGRKVHLYDDIMTDKELSKMVHPEPLRFRRYE